MTAWARPHRMRGCASGICVPAMRPCPPYENPCAPTRTLPEGPIMLGHNRKKMLGAECMADMLKGYGVTHVFHVPAVLRRSFVEMERRTDIKRLHVHGEKSAAYMADGYARASGKP